MVIQVNINYRDLNNIYPKDDFPFSLTELLVDTTKGYEALSFMDGYSDYNEIQMAKEDKEVTTFCTPKGIFYYKFTSFNLKNVGAINQKAVTHRAKRPPWLYFLYTMIHI